MTTTEERQEAAAKKAAEQVRKADEKKAKEKAKAAGKREKDKEKKKQAAEAKLKGAQVQAMKKLAPVAKEINSRLDKAAKMEDDAYDHRLAAALQSVIAKEQCKGAKINFKDWVGDNVEQSYETVRKYVAIGEADNPEEALREQREKNRLANHALRTRQRLAITDRSGGKKGAAASRDTKPTVTPADRIKQGFEAITDGDHAANVLKSHATKLGLAVVTEADAKKVGGKSQTVLEGLQTRFTDAPNKTKFKFVQWACEQIGVTLTDDFAVPTDGIETDENGDPVLPESLRRNKRGGKRKAA